LVLAITVGMPGIGRIIFAMKRLAASAVAFCGIAVALGQAQPATGALAGRVYALAKGSDIKPARMAHVFIASGDDQVTLQQNLDRALAKRLEDLKSNTDAQQACLAASVSIHEALKSGDSIQTLNTDEDGYFDATKLKAGTCMVVAMGSANGYQSVWYLTTTVIAGKRQKVKLPEPALACQ